MRFYKQRTVAHRRQDLAELDIKLHKRFVVAVMDNLPVNETRVELARAANEIRDLVAFLITQTKLAGAQPNRGVHHLFTRPGHQVEHHQLIGVGLRHVVDNLAHIEAHQVVCHILSQLKAGNNLAMHLVAAAAADAVVGVILEDLFPHFLQQTVVIVEAESPGKRRQRLKHVDDFILDTRMGDFNVHARGADCPVHTHVFPVDKLPFQRRQFIAPRLNMVKHLLEAARHKLTLRIDFTKLLHHRKKVLLQRHLVVAVGQQNLFGDGGVFQDLEITVEPFS